MRLRSALATLHWACLGLALALSACGGPNPDEALSAAKATHAKGDRNAAILQLKSSIQEHPEHAESRLYLGLLYDESGDSAGAAKEFRRALDLGIAPGRVKPQLAHALIMQGQAKQVLEEISTDRITDPVALAGVLSGRGLAHLLLKQPEEARASFEKALAAKPEFAGALLGRARLFALDRKLEEGLSEIERSLKTEPKNAEALMLKADFLRALDRMDEARSAYQKLVGLYPDHVNGLLALVSLDVASGKLDEAAGHLAAVRKASPGNPMASYFDAMIAFRKRDYAAARDAIAGVLKVAPNHLPSLLLGGAVEFLLGSQELAQARLKYVLERVPGNAYARRLLAASYARAGQTQKAIEVLDPLLRQGTKDPLVLALAAETYLRSGDYAKAQALFQQAASLAPQNPELRTGLGLSRLAAGEIDAATADLQAASQLDTSQPRADVLLIATYLQRRQFDQALKAAQSLAGRMPENPLSHNLVAAAYTGKGDIPNARRALEKALELQPDYTPAAANLAQLDLQSGDKKAARKRFEDILARDKSNVQAYIALASLGPLIDASDEEVKGWLEAARKESPGMIQPLVLLARAYLRAGEPKKALELVDKAMAGASDNLEVLDLAGQVQLAAGDKNRALSTFSKWIMVQPSAMAHFRMGTAQLANDDLNGAANSLRKAIAFRPQFPEAQVLLAQTESSSGRTGEAIAIALTLQQQNPRSPVGWVVEGDTLMRDKKFDRAIKAYEHAYLLQKSGSTAMKLHAAFAQSGRGAEGEKILKGWLNAQPGDQTARLYLAEAYLKEKKYRAAIEEYETLLKLSPDNVVALNNLAWCYHQIKDGRAVETAEKALKLAPKNPAVLDTLGWMLVEGGDAKRAIELLKSGLELAPENPEIRYHFALALAKTGEKARAKNELERLLIDFPKFSQADQAMQALTELRRQ